MRFKPTTVAPRHQAPEGGRLAGSGGRLGSPAWSARSPTEVVERAPHLEATLDYSPCRKLAVRASVLFEVSVGSAPASQGATMRSNFVRFLCVMACLSACAAAQVPGWVQVATTGPSARAQHA